MIFRMIFITAALFLASANTRFAENNDRDYDVICHIYTEAYNTNMPISTLSQYILNNINERVHSKDAKEAHEAVMHALAESRYSLFKSSAEHTLKHTWDCKSMELIMDMRVK